MTLSALVSKVWSPITPGSDESLSSSVLELTPLIQSSCQQMAWVVFVARRALEGMKMEASEEEKELGTLSETVDYADAVLASLNVISASCETMRAAIIEHQRQTLIETRR